jgi:hypothetical protein
MDQELDKYICEQFNIKYQALDILDLWELCLRHIADISTYRRTHKIFGTVIHTCHHGCRSRRYFWHGTIRPWLYYQHAYEHHIHSAFDDAFKFNVWRADPKYNRDVVIKECYAMLLRYIIQRKNRYTTPIPIAGNYITYHHHPGLTSIHSRKK